ncbi:MAG: hypothetical protein PHP54_05220 [Clostridia bacterium]|nr:hypothetical protein [Clostridia bacterium]
MKKFLIVFFICVILVGGVFLVYKNPKITNHLRLMISDIADSFTTKKNVAYDANFKVNDLGITNNTFYFDTLSDEQKKIYTAIANGVKTLENKIDIKEYNFVDSDTAMKDIEITLHKFLLDHPDVFYLEEKYSVESVETLTKTRVKINLNYSVETVEKLDEKVKEISTKIEEIVKACNLVDGEDFNNEVKLHDYLGEKINYYKYEKISDIPNKCHNIYGALIENSAVCDGIAKSLQVILDKVNVSSIVVSGNLKAEAHAWNLVKLDNEWYHTDLTSNKSIESDKGNVVVHSYFNITDGEIKKTHIIDEPEKLPKATATTNNYYVKTGSFIDNANSFDTILKKVLDNNKNTKLLEFKTSNISDIPDKTIRVLKNGNYTNYLEKNSTKFVYYNILDTYIVFKK